MTHSKNSIDGLEDRVKREIYKKIKPFLERVVTPRTIKRIRKKCEQVLEKELSIKDEEVLQHMSGELMDLLLKEVQKKEKPHEQTTSEDQTDEPERIDPTVSNKGSSRAGSPRLPSEAGDIGGDDRKIWLPGDGSDGDRGPGAGGIRGSD